MIGTEDRVRRKPEPLFTRLDDELLGIDTQAGLAYSLNRSGARIWQLIDGWVTVGSLCEQLRQEYEIAPEACSQQVVSLLGRLREAGLIEVEPAAAR